MRELYIIRNSIIPYYMIQDGMDEHKRKNFTRLEEIIKYFNTETDGKKLKARKNLKIYVDAYNDDEREKILNTLAKIQFKKSYIEIKKHH